MKKKLVTNKFKVGDMVYDSWWPWMSGRVKKVLKTRVVIDIWPRLGRGGLTVYDKAHLQFLRLDKKQ